MARPIEQMLDLLGDECIGVLGAGQLGRSVAVGLLEAGLPEERLLLSYRGSPRSRAALAEANLGRFVATNDLLASRARLVLCALRPQDSGAVASLPLREDAIFISLMAGVPLDSLQITPPPEQRARIMTSAPETIQQRHGIAAFYPNVPVPDPRSIATPLVSALRMHPFPVTREEDLDAFTVLGPCLPILLVCLDALGMEAADADLLAFADRNRVPDAPALIAWARTVRPSDCTQDAREQYIAQAATPGGVTEAVVNAARAGRTVTEALDSGLARCRALARLRS